MKKTEFFYDKNETFEIKSKIPNSETIEAIEEVKKMQSNPEQYQGYTDVDEMIRELLK